MTTAGQHADPHGASNPEQVNDGDQQDLRSEDAERADVERHRHEAARAGGQIGRSCRG
jgi:hypothetical protein